MTTEISETDIIEIYLQSMLIILHQIELLRPLTRLNNENMT